MTEARIIDGKAFAAGLRRRVGEAVAILKRDAGLVPGLAVVLVGDDPASRIYVKNKAIAARETGMLSFGSQLPADTSEADLLAKVRALNTDPSVHGILVQFPVPDQISQAKVIDTIDPAKDVDGLHPINGGRLLAGRDGLLPCTPTGCLLLIKHALGDDLSGKRALVIGRSLLVGKPMALMLLGQNCTVTLAHSRTQDLAGECRRAHIIVAAVGKAELVKGDWIQPGACVIDVGMNRIPAPERGEGKTRLVGDVAFDEAVQVAGAITPVPGGVGPMTIACLLRNGVIAACRQANLPVPKM